MTLQIKEAAAGTNCGGPKLVAVQSYSIPKVSHHEKIRNNQAVFSRLPCFDYDTKVIDIDVMLLTVGGRIIDHRIRRSGFTCNAVGLASTANAEVLHV